MSLQDLRRMGSLIDQENWHSDNHRASVSVARVMPSIIIGIAGCFAIAFGNGSWITWAGLLAFVVALFTFIFTNVNAIDRRQP